MNNNIETITQEIRNLVPKDQFHTAYHDIYEGLTKLWAEKLVSELPENLTFEMVDNQMVLQRKEEENKDGFEKMVQDASRIFTDQTNPTTFAQHLESRINDTHWIKFLQR